MKSVKIYSHETILKLTRKRSGENKIGDFVGYSKNSNWKNELENSLARFVILGIPEDIGVRANFGRGGANTAFIPAIDSFLSQQHNQFLNGETIFLLGEINVEDEMEKASQLHQKTKSDIEALRNLVSKIDDKVSDVIQFICSLKKIPIIVGGGHNNAFGNIKGASLAYEKKINVINCDPHLDFRPLEGRHSGNGFSYAFKDNFLEKYAVFAMHEQYNNSGSLNEFLKYRSQLYFTTYETIFVREELEMKKALQNCIGFVKNNVCGLELDLDSITNVPSSAKTSSGISPIQARQYVYQCAKQLSPIYFHIAEGAPILSHIKADNKTGKLIAYLISDFVKGINEGFNFTNIKYI